MKKTYTKPYIAVESFQLDAAIASSCSGDNKVPLHFGANSCNGDPSQTGGYFGDRCVHDMTDFQGGDSNDMICYHGPIPGIGNLFMNS